jgi:CheY-like chemotaxis protein
MLLKRKRILLLDDDPSIQRVIGLLLKREGYRVDTVPSGSEAIAKLGEAEYDVLLLDVMTPTEGGMTVIKYLREKNPALVKKVVLVTATPDVVLQNVKDIHSIIRKPFESESLLKTVAEVAD